MKVYDCFGTFDVATKSFNLAVQTTNIGFDKFYISALYNICSPSRFAVIAILQTAEKNANDMTSYPPDCGMIASEVKFSSLLPNFLQAIDKDITTITKDDQLVVYTLHATDFDLKNPDDIQNVLIRKADNFPIIIKGSPPSVGGKGVLL